MPQVCSPWEKCSQVRNSTSQSGCNVAYQLCAPFAQKQADARYLQFLRTPKCGHNRASMQLCCWICTVEPEPEPVPSGKNSTGFQACLLVTYPSGVCMHTQYRLK